MNKKLRAKIVKEWAGDLPIEQKIVRLFEKVRDIPYGSIGSRDPKDVYEKNMGTCSGKHLLLRELYDEIGIETKDMITMFRLNDFLENVGMELPPEIEEILNRGPVYDFHGYIRIHVDGEWINVDATNDKPLKKYGFVVNEDWDGKTDLALGIGDVDMGLTWDCGHRGLEEKVRKVAFLPEEMQRNRELLIKGLTKWCAKLRKKGEA